MASFVVCARCGKVHEITYREQLPKGWSVDLLCPRCADNAEDEAAIDVVEEEVIYPPGDVVETFEDTLDEPYCDACFGHCQGH